MMRHYFYAESNQQHGPFTLDELTAKNIQPETLVWYDGLKDWTKASELDEFKHLFAATPPPLTKNSPTPPAVSTRKKSLPVWRIVAGTALLTALVVVIMIQSSGSPSSLEDPSSPGIDDRLERIDVNGKFDDEEQAPPKPPTEEELRAALLKKELARPTDYLRTEYEYRYRLLAGDYEIKGDIFNAATQATYKDVVLTLIYYTKTDTELKRENYVIYKYVEPNSSASFLLNVDAPGATRKIEMEIARAVGEERVR